MRADEAYFEHGISRVHGFLREYHVEEPRYLVPVPATLRHVAATTILRNRALEVTTFGLEQASYLNSELVEAIDASYVSTRQTSLAHVAAQGGAFDLVFPGVLILSSVTGGMRRSEVPSDAINLHFVLGTR